MLAGAHDGKVEELIEAMQRHHGVARAKQLREAGISRRTLEAALVSGLIERVRPGLYASPGADPLLARCAETNSLLTCVSAGEHHGLWVLHPSETVHVLRADGRFRSEKAVVHRRSWAPSEPGSFAASLLDTLMHALTCLPELEALVMVESAILQKRVSLEELRARLLGPGSLRALAILDLVDRGADSLIETLARVHLRRAGLRVESQVRVEGVGSMDHIVEDCVDVELDGQTHQEPASRYNDYARDIKAQSRGYAVARFGYADVVYRPELMVRQVKDVVARRLAMGALPVRK